MQKCQPFPHQLIVEKIDSRQVAARPRETRDQAKHNRVFSDAKDDGDRRCRSCGCKRSKVARWRGDDCHPGWNRRGSCATSRQCNAELHRYDHLAGGRLQCDGPMPCHRQSLLPDNTLLANRASKNSALRIEPVDDLRPHSGERLASKQDSKMLQTNPTFTRIFDDPHDAQRMTCSRCRARTNCNRGSAYF
jgi:hypothetical protein